MRYSGTDRDDDYAPWFRLGSVDVTTTTFVVLLWVVTLLVFTVEPVDKPIMLGMALIPDDVASGEVWRAFTWPWSHTGFGLWDLIGVAIFWLFGTDLERQVGRRPFAWLLGASIIIIALAATAWSQLLPGDTVIADLDLLVLTVVLLYVAEHPTRPFFFNIPAWVVGAVIVALELVNDLAFREWIRLLTVLLAAALITLVARKVGLLTMYERVPDVRWPRRTGTRGKGPAPAAPPSRPARPASETKRPGRLWGKREDDAPAEILPMPPQRLRPVDTSGPDMSADDLALDLLLDKIADGGLDALTPGERQSLDELRARRRRGPSS